MLGTLRVNVPEMRKIRLGIFFFFFVQILSIKEQQLQHSIIQSKKKIKVKLELYDG